MNARLLASVKSTNPSDFRKSERKLCRVSGLLYVEGCPPMRVKTVDLSANGVALLLPVALPHRTVCDLSFHLYLGGLLRRFAAKIEILNSVFLSADVRAGCRFLILDEESRKTLNEFMKADPVR